ncbi:DUF2062 domain-containing protein [Ramlibacter sp. USB13]|uniref:DUF2062 domain-containing protein n=1 Tax=Ramlibacter cellulosilyticus TaxID=2764187 RepID=A0A923MRS6_9BURK|nr:DUF2062 domain-containing protein [Ramlibacter cellulosilyticus]MBC5784637.1 DUF2062 domain-containing protein [Ramlibacter cellulosilyticus]
MRDWIRRWTPTEEKLRQQPGLRWLAPLLGRPVLWQLSRRRVALGAAAGVFCGFMIPVAQIAGAALLALLLRANLPVAALSTLVTNPVTFGPIFVLAYRTGSAVLGEPTRPEEAEALARGTEQSSAAPARGGARDWIERAREIGRPIIVGMVIFAVAGSILAWVLVQVGWTVAVLVKRRRRVRRTS